MVLFKTEINYDYKKEVGNKVYVDPMFYTAYQYARKSLINMFPEDELLENIETEKDFYSIDLKLRPNAILKKARVSSFLDEEALENINVSPLFFELMEILPYYYSYRFYENASLFVPEMEISLRGPKRNHRDIRSGTLTEQINRIKNTANKRGVNETVDTLNINYLFIYLSLGESNFPTVSSFQNNSIEDYLDKLKTTILSIRDLMDKVTPSMDAFKDLLPNAGNEARASFFNALQPSYENFDEYVNASIQDSTFTTAPFLYPISIETAEVASDVFNRRPRNLVDFKTEDVPYLEKVSNTLNTNPRINVGEELNRILSENNFNMRIVYERKETHFYYFRKLRQHDFLSGLMRDSLRKINHSIREEQNSAEGATP